MNIDNNTRDYWPTNGWRTCLPEEQGVDSERIYRLFTAIISNQDTIHSLLIAKNGYLITEGYFPPFHKKFVRHIYSITKVFTATLFGMAIEDGYFKNINQKIVDLFTGKTINHLSEGKKNISIKDCLLNRTGVEWGDVLKAEALSDIMLVLEMFKTPDWGKFVLDREQHFPPGEFFGSNSPGTQLLSSVFTHVTGKSLHQYAKEKMFTPLGIKDTQWWESGKNENSGAQGLCLNPEDALKFGYLYLNEGVWEGKRIIPAKWVTEATQKQAETRDNHKKDFCSGLGFQWFIISGLPCYTYASYGAYGQYLFIVKDLDLVVMVNADLALNVFKSKIYNYLKDYIIPACKQVLPLKKNISNTCNPEDLLSTDLYKTIPDTQRYIPSWVRQFSELEYSFAENTGMQLIEDHAGRMAITALSIDFKNNCNLKVQTGTTGYCIPLDIKQDTFLTSVIKTEQENREIAVKAFWENDYILNLIYFTNYGKKGTFSIKFSNDKEKITCDYDNILSHGSAEGKKIHSV